MSNSYFSFDGYGFRHLPVHFAQVSNGFQLRRLLLDFHWLQSKLEATEVTALIEDYDLGLQLFSDDRTIAVIRRALLLSSHVLHNDTTQLASQLLGRLLEIDDDEIKKLIDLAEKWRGASWLRPLTASLVTHSDYAVRTLIGHTESVTTLTISPNNDYVISGSRDTTLKIWNLNYGQVQQTLIGHTGPVNSVQITPDGRYIISGSSDNTLKIWDWKIGKEVQTLDGHKSEVTAVAITPNSRYIISASYDKTIKIWDLTNGNLTSTWSYNAGLVKAITALAISPNGEYVISGTDRAALRIWRLENGEVIGVLNGIVDHVNSIDIAPNGKQVVVGLGSDDWNLELWDFESRHSVCLFHTLYSIRAVTFSPDAQYILAASQSGNLEIWKPDQRVLHATLKGHTGPINAVITTSNQRYAITGANDATIKIWDLQALY